MHNRAFQEIATVLDTEARGVNKFGTDNIKINAEMYNVILYVYVKKYISYVPIPIPSDTFPTFGPIILLIYL